MYLDRQDSLKNKIVVSIPFALENRQAIASSLSNKYSTDYIFLGDIFQDRINNETCKISIELCKESLNNKNINWLINLGQDNLSEKTLKQIDSCQQIVYLITEKTGYDACLKIAKYAQIFLSIGGIAVKVDSAGIVCDRDKWLANYDSEDVFDIYSLFVTLVEGDNYYYSCGMNNFGLADVSIDFTEDIGLAIYVMNVFNYYRLTDTVILKDGQTFQPDFECPVYQMQWQKCDEYEINDLRYNFCGRWHLSRVTNNLDITYRVN